MRTQIYLVTQENRSRERINGTVTFRTQIAHATIRECRSQMMGRIHAIVTKQLPIATVLKTVRKVILAFQDGAILVAYPQQIARTPSHQE